MKHAADFRKKARETLHSKWILAVLVGLVMSIISGRVPTILPIIKLRDYHNVGQYIRGISLIGTVWGPKSTIFLNDIERF